MIIRDEFKAGVLIVIGLALFALSIWVMGSEQQIFARQGEYYVSFKNVAGLSEGAPVRLAGITIGRVAGIGFSKEPNDPRVYVSLLVNEVYFDRVRQDSLATIETQGLLGDKYVEMTPGTGAPPAEPGSTLQSQEPADIGAMMNRASAAVENVVKVSEDVSEFFNTINKETVENLTNAAESIAHISAEIETGDGLLHRLIYSKKEGEKLTNDFSALAQNLNKIMEEVRHGKGIVHALVYDPAGHELVKTLNTAATDFAVMSKKIAGIAGEIERGNGLVHAMIYNPSPEGAVDIVNKLNKTADNLLAASNALALGSGTIGALLVDPSLYDNLMEITDEAKRSFLLREAIRSSLKK